MPEPNLKHVVKVEERLDVEILKIKDNLDACRELGIID